MTVKIDIKQYPDYISLPLTGSGRVYFNKITKWVINTEGVFIGIGELINNKLELIRKHRDEEF